MDQREAPPIGKRSDGTDFMAESDVGAWFTQALGTEIARKGLVVTQAASQSNADASGAAFVVSGSVDEVWITEKNAAEYSIRMRGTLIMHKGNQTLINQSYATSLSRRVVPGPGVPKELLSEAVADIVGPMARAVYEKVYR